MKIRSTHLSIATGSIILLGSCNNPQEANQSDYNVLFIMSDDLNDNLGCYGHPLVKTPNLDKLAEKGVMFNSAYSQIPLCGPSRVSLLTGLRPDTTNVIINETDFRDYLGDDYVTLPQMFMNNGYFVGRVGKLYHYGVPGEIGTLGHFDDSLSWMERSCPYGRDKVEEDILINYSGGKRLGGAMAFLKAKGTDEEQTDGMVATDVIKMMTEHKDEPFFIAAGFFRPHCPYVAPKEYFEWYDTAEIKIPYMPEGDRDDVPDIAFHNKKDVMYHGVKEEWKLKNITQAYYASISFVDAQVGRIMNALDSLGLAENTIVVFMSDHGYHLGEHGLWHKYFLFEEGDKVPMIMYFPGKNLPVKKVDHIIEMLDVYPTLAEACGMKAPDCLHGYSIFPILNNPDAPWKKAAISAVGRHPEGKFERNKVNAGYELVGKGVRTKDWRYNEWGGGKMGAELYDHINDPKEFNNLANDTAYADVIAELKKYVNVKGKIPVEE